MIGKKDTTAAGTGELNALLGRGSEFEGTLKFEGTVRVDGKFKGEIHSEGTLIVGEHANLDAKIKVGTAVVSGTITGDMEAKSRVELHSPARVTGNLSAPTLSVQDGVVFNGSCQMGGKPGQATASKPSILSGKDKNGKQG